MSLREKQNSADAGKIFIRFTKDIFPFLELWVQNDQFFESKY